MSSPRMQVSTFAQVPTCLAWTKAAPPSTCQVRDPWRRIPLPIMPCCRTNRGSRAFSHTTPTPSPPSPCSSACFSGPVTFRGVNAQLRVNSILSACSSNSQCFQIYVISDLMLPINLSSELFNRFTYSLVLVEFPGISMQKYSLWVW